MVILVVHVPKESLVWSSFTVGSVTDTGGTPGEGRVEREYGRRDERTTHCKKGGTVSTELDPSGLGSNRQ